MADASGCAHEGPAFLRSKHLSKSFALIILMHLVRKKALRSGKTSHFFSNYLRFIIQKSLKPCFYGFPFFFSGVLVFDFIRWEETWTTRLPVAFGCNFGKHYHALAIEKAAGIRRPKHGSFATKEDKQAKKLLQSNPIGPNLRSK